MPLNEIERHPFKNYFVEFHGSIEKVPWEHYQKLIVGSFPVYSLTETVYPEVENPKRFLSCTGIPFYYGSNSNQFWEYLITTINGPDAWSDIKSVSPLEQKRKLINFLERNHILLTDIIEQTNRFTKVKGVDAPESPSDAALLRTDGVEKAVKSQLKFNSDICTWIQKCPNLQSVYFTAQKAFKGKSPAGWFFQMLGQNKVGYKVLKENPNSALIQLDFPSGIKRKLNFFFLPTPSASRSIALTEDYQHEMFVGYIKSVKANLHQSLAAGNYKLDKGTKQEVAGLRKDFIMEWWRQFVVNVNLDYSGEVLEHSNEAVTNPVLINP